MAKRFIETTIWTQNQWFRKLPLPVRLFWFYLISNCDSVGVWEEDFELASFIIGNELCKEEVYAHLDGKIKIISEKKIWIKDFCSFQYGELKEEAITNRPHQSYITLLKKHRLWIDYQYSMNRDKEKDKEPDMEKGKDQDREEEKEQTMESEIGIEDEMGLSELPF
jgi:hypothetical protein